RIVQAHDRVRERCLRPAGEITLAASVGVADPDKSAVIAGARAARLAGRPLPVTTFRRSTAAHSAGPRTGGRASRTAPGRALRRPRCQSPQGTAALVAAPAR